MNRKLSLTLSVFFVVLLLGLVVAVGLGAAPHVRAASPIYVRMDGDDAICNGQYDAPATGAPNCAFAAVGKGVAEVDTGGTIIVGTGVYTENVSISKDLTLQGAGATSTILDGGGTDLVVFVSLGRVVDISGVTVRNGNYSWGGGIRNMGTLTLTNSTVASNSATSGGGGIYNSDSARLIISDCVVVGNTSGGRGGGIENASSMLTLVNSAVISNSADSNGGGIYSSGGELTMRGGIVRGNQASGSSRSGGGIFNDSQAILTNLTISGNSSSHRSGGIHNQDPMTLTNVTISGNSATDYGGAMIHAGSVTLTVVNCTVVTNTVPSGTGTGGMILYSPATVENTLLAHNNNGNCGGSGLISHGHNLDSGNACGFSAPGDITNTDPLIGPLADNGGPVSGLGEATLTHALLAGSPAIDAGSCVVGVATDQRGVARPQGVGCDIGAYEFTFYSVFLPLVERSR
jgi:predicted outer membrane repeat protein